MPQTEITAPVQALDVLGRPQNFGWARTTNLIYNPELLSVPRRSVSESDRYILYSPTHMVVLEILDDGYMGYMGVSVISMKDRKRSTHTFFTPFSLGSFELPGDSNSGSIKMRQKKSLLNFAAMDGGVRIIRADIPKFGHHRNLRGEVVLTPPPGGESLITLMPWREKRNAFSYSRRSPCYSAEGVIQFSSTEIIFTQGNAWGIFDWHRGVRPRSDLRFWAAGCGQYNGRRVGFCAGYNSADSSQGTENAFFLDGRLHKLDQVTFHIPQERLVPWRFTSNDNRLEMIFIPHQERDDNRQMFLYSQRRWQLYGSFAGKVVLDDGTDITFHGITGLVERRKTRL